MGDIRAEPEAAQLSLPSDERETGRGKVTHTEGPPS